MLELTSSGGYGCMIEVAFQFSNSTLAQRFAPARWNDGPGGAWRREAAARHIQNFAARKRNTQTRYFQSLAVKSQFFTACGNSSRNSPSRSK